MKRKLSKQEIKICQKSMARMKERNIYLDYLEEYTNLMLNKGIGHNKKRKEIEIVAQSEVGKEAKEITEKRVQINSLNFEILRIQMQEDIRTVQSEKDQNIKDMKILQDQISNGVEMKVKVEEKKEVPSGVG